MNKRILMLGNKFNALSLRERGFVFIALLTVIYMGWHMILYSYVLASDEEIANNMQKIKSQINQLEGQIDTISEVVGRNPTNALLERIRTLKSENAVFSAKIREDIKSMVSPQQMDSLIHEIVLQTQNLTVVGIESLPAQPLFPEKELKVNGTEGVFQVYDHGIKIEWIGGFFETLQFLKALEKKKMHVVWEDLSYEVQAYPKAKSTLVLHTLSLEEAWVGV